MKDLRINNKTKLYIIIEDACEDGISDIETFVFDNEQEAKEHFQSLVKQDKKFLAEEGRDDTIEESEVSYCSFPEGEYSTTHYSVSLLATKNAYSRLSE